MVRGESPFKTLENFIKYANENPGKLKLAGPDSKTFHNTITDIFAKETGIEFTWIPYEAGNDAVLALMGSNVELYLLRQQMLLLKLRQGKLKY
ncbi:MAG: tripartite tricarboxylate transporter substrate-binding protein [Peptococcaceae bacterium]